MGVAKGDRVIIYMPMIPEAPFAMLACARIGAVHSVVFGGFAAKELATRIDDAKPTAILSASCGIEGAKVVAYKPSARRSDRDRQRTSRPCSSRSVRSARAVSCWRGATMTGRAHGR
jgi:acyl-coenzyme A synthetase/AMP-(fatty) acid ligase